MAERINRELDWDKVKTVEDIKVVLKGIYHKGIFQYEDNFYFKEIKHLLKDK